MSSFYAIGILWSSGKSLYPQLIKRILSEYDLMELLIIDLKKKYGNFILDCYRHDEEVMSDGYIDEKIRRLLQDKSSVIIIFSINITNPKFRVNKRNKNIECIQVRMMKEQLREQFSKKVRDYFLDNIIHASDNYQESEIMRNVVEKYSNYALKRYIKKGNNSILGKSNNRIKTVGFSLKRTREATWEK